MIIVSFFERLAESYDVFTLPSLNAFDIKFYKSSFSTSLGGDINLGAEINSFTLHNLFPKTTKTEATTGITKFRCVYIKNTNTTDPIRNPILTIPQNTISPNDEMSIGFDPAGLTSSAQVITDENTYPTNVTFTFANDRANGAVLGQNIPPGKAKAFWLRLTSRFGAQEMLTNALVVRLLADNLVTQVIDQAPVPSSTASFTLTGETDLNNSLNSIVDEIQYRNANLNISTGNNTGNPTSQNPEDYFSVLGDALSRVTRTALGANDMKSTSQINQYLNRYGNTNKYHSFTYQDIHFLFMDTASGPAAYATSSPQYEFVVNDLKSAAADPAIDWIFVIMNRAMYASQTTTRTLYVLKSLRDIYHPLFEQYGVHVVVNGYFRNYQRQHILRFNGADSDNPTTILSGSAPNYLITKGNATFDDGSGNTGCLFINAGMGGTSHDSIPSPSSFTAANNTANFGYLFFLMNNVKTYAIPGDLTSGLLEDYHEIICSFYDESQDVLRDQFSIRKIVGQNVQQSSKHRYNVEVL